MKENIVMNKSYAFALRIIKTSKETYGSKR